jgi:GT2 family glycosyltransferase
LTWKVGIVVPTLGKRPDYIRLCLESIDKAGSGANKPFVTLVAPQDADLSGLISEGLAHEIIKDPGLGLAAAINSGFDSMPIGIEYINWLGDDDMIAVGSLDLCSGFLDKSKSVVMVFGGCDYVDPDGQVVFTNKSSSLAIPLMRFGPDLVPQPGALFRRDAFTNVGGLNTAYSWAFDFDLFIKLAKTGKLVHIKKTLSSFRWHPESLSVEFRSKSVSEASAVRVSHLPAILRPFSFLWEYLVKEATLVAGNRVTRIAKKKAKRS